jgi:hypothetical protein
MRMFQSAFDAGFSAALRRFKLADGTLGADYGVAPSGEEQSHGPRLNEYPLRRGSNPQLGSDYQFTTRSHGKDYGTDFLWNLSEYDKLAPGATGEFGQEVIG